MSISYAQNVGLVKTPPRVEINGKYYRTVQVGSLVWMAEYFDDTSITYSTDSKGVKNYSANTIRSAISGNTLVLPTGWRLPSQSDLGGLFSYSPLSALMDTGDIWNNHGTNETTMALKPTDYEPGGPSGLYVTLTIDSTNNYYYVSLNNGNFIRSSYGSSDYSNQKFPCRFCRNA